MMPTSKVPVTLLFADGVTQRLSVPIGTMLFEATTSAGLNLLTDCANGKCGTCTAQLVSGSVNLEKYDSAVLTDEDRAQGAVLPCICRVIAPCALEFPYDSSEAMTDEPSPLTATVISAEQVATDIIKLEVQVDDEVNFEPGQYVRIRPMDSSITRSYSMSNVPGINQLEFFIRLVEGGEFSQWLVGAKAGDLLELSRPRGTFFLRDEDRPRLFVAGGTGIAPFLSMLRVIASQDSKHCTTVLVGARTSDHLIAMKELAELKAKIPELRLEVATEKGTDSDCHTGYATDLITRLNLDPRTRVYLCGPPPMVEAGRNAAMSAGLNRTDVLCERFA
jgi:3-phenylpropionate/trans-cinnamate dioxygenase ferredoxin reductase subunit/benzoate/toluate 1,2-dioxygenase reductase subunit